MFSMINKKVAGSQKVEKSAKERSFSEIHPETVYNVEMRRQKAGKIIAVLEDYYSDGLGKLSALDLGCAAGIISKLLSEKFATVIGVDVDGQAIEYARKNNSSGNLQFEKGDGIFLNFSDNSFDVVVSSHIYEHVSDADRLLSEIYRVLKPGGTCYFAAGNRLQLIEPHYRLPLLSLMPKAVANCYLRIFKRDDRYEENLLTLSGLRRLISRFEVKDYTLKIIEEPEKYSATEMIREGSYKQKTAVWITRNLYWLLPTYIWLLCKKAGEE